MIFNSKIGFDQSSKIKKNVIKIISGVNFKEVTWEVDQYFPIGLKSG